MVQFIDNRPQKAGIAGANRRRRRRINKVAEPYYKASNGQTVFQSIDEGDFELSANHDASYAITLPSEASVDHAVEENSGIAVPKHLSTQDRGFESSCAAAAAPRNKEEDTACSTAEKQQQQIEFLLDQLQKRESEVAQLQKEKRASFLSRDPTARHPPPLFDESLDDLVGDCRMARSEASVCSCASKVLEVVRSPPRKRVPVSRQDSGSATNLTAISAGAALSPSETSPRTKLFASSQRQQQCPQSKPQSPSPSLLPAVGESERDSRHHKRVDAQRGGDEAMIVNPSHQTPVSIASDARTEDRDMAHQREIQSLVNEHKNLLASVASQYRTQISVLEAEKKLLQQTAKRRSDELKTAVKEHQEAIDSLDARRAKDVQYLNEAHREAARALSLQRENDLAELGRKHGAELEAVRIKAVEQRLSLQAQLSEEVTRAFIALREEHRLEMEQTELRHADEVKTLKDEVADWERKAKLAGEFCSQKTSGIGVDTKTRDPRRLARPCTRDGPSLLESLKESSPPAKKGVSLAHHTRMTSSDRRGKHDRNELGKHNLVDESHCSEKSPRKKSRTPRQDAPPTYNGEPIATCVTRRGGKSRTTLVIHSLPNDN